MNKDKVLVIQANIIMKPDELEHFRKQFMKQKEEGVVMLPYFFDAVWADKEQIEAAEPEEGLCAIKLK